MTNPTSKAPDSWRQHMFGVRLIAILKLVKGVLLLCVGLGALALIGKDVAELAKRIVEDIGADPDKHYIHVALVKLDLVDRQMLRRISAGTFIYSALLLTEGFGLLWDKLWAEYLTVIATSLFLPLEVYEIFKHLTAPRIAVFLLNILIVWYLAARLHERRHERKEAAKPE